MKNIVLCGSMKVKDEIFKIQKELISMGYNVLLPEECLKGLPKEIASRAHFDRICNLDNENILIVNAKKDNIDNYIGPNSFAEIAMAFYQNKRVYLLYEIYKPYEDELKGWKVIPLNGDLTRLK